MICYNVFMPTPKISKSKIKRNIQFFKVLKFISIAIILLTITFLLKTKKVTLNKMTITNPVTDTQSITKTSSWKTYYNQESGVSFKFPPSEKVMKCGGEVTNDPNIISSPADGTEKECVSTSISIIDLNFSRGPLAKSNDDKGRYTTVQGKPTYETIHEVSSTDSERNKQVYIEFAPNQIVSLIGRYNDDASIRLFDTVLSTLQFNDIGKGDSR